MAASSSSTSTATTNNRLPYYTTMSNTNDRFFQDEQIQRFDAETIRNRYGEHWRNFASNIREITQPDGSIIKEYIIEDPTMLEQMQGTTSQRMDSASDEDHQHNVPSKNKFAEIKAKFEQKQVNYVMDSPSTSSVTSSQATSRSNSHKPSDDLYNKHRRASNESAPSNRTANERESVVSSHPSHSSHTPTHPYQRSQSMTSEKSKPSTIRRLDSADEADEEVRRIHRQGEELRRYHQDLSPISSVNEAPSASRVQYEVLDEDGNPLAIEGVQDLIQMSGVRAREVPQPDGTVVKEYVIDDPEILSKLRPPTHQQTSPTGPSYGHQFVQNNDAPPPPPRIPLRQPLLFRPGPAGQDQLPINIQQINVLEPQRRYEFITTAGRRIQFLITAISDLNGQPISDSDIRELSHAIHSRLGPLSSNNAGTPVLAQLATAPQAPFTHPKPWFPSVDFTQRTTSNRQRIGSDTHMAGQESRSSSYQQAPADLTRSASYGALNQGVYLGQTQQPIYNQQQTVDWNSYRQQDFQGQMESPMVRQVVHQRPSSSGPVQTSAQFLPQQQPQQPQATQYRTRSTVSPPINAPVFYQQSMPYPTYSTQPQQVPMHQQQQQPDIRLLNQNGYGFSQARVIDGQARI